MRVDWAINWDGSESCVTECFADYGSCDHGEHYSTFHKAKRALIDWHKERARDHMLAAKTWRKVKAPEKRK